MADYHMKDLCREINLAAAGLARDMAAGPASYGMTDTMGRMHQDAQFAGSSSVPAHVEMMGFLGIGNNPMAVSYTHLDVYKRQVSFKNVNAFK